MYIITAREFRANQKKYLDLAATEKVVILRNNSPSIQLVPMLDDETTISAALLAKIEKSRKDIKEGKGKTCRSVDELNAYLEKL